MSVISIIPLPLGPRHHLSTHLSLPFFPHFFKIPPQTDLWDRGIPCWHFPHLLRKRKCCLRQLPMVEGTVEGHFLWDCPSVPCCLSLLMSSRHRGPENISCGKQRRVLAISQADIPGDPTVLWLLATMPLDWGHRSHYIERAAPYTTALGKPALALRAKS